MKAKYKMLYIHPRRVPEHIWKAEQALGRRLPAGAQVHHVDSDGFNNVNSNLVICQDYSYHALLHMRARVLRAGGDPNTQRMCSTCKTVKTFDSFYRHHKHGLQTQCGRCGVETSKSSQRRARAKRMDCAQ